jgi:DNA-3-methyladenine glycosylase II
MSHVDLVMTDHPGWIPARKGGGKLRVFVSVDGGRWLVRTGGPTAFTLRELAPACFKPFSDAFQLPPDALTDLPQLADGLAGLGTVVRFRAGNLWDALGTAAVRQMLRAPHGDRLYRQFCQACGEHVQLPTGEDYWLFPTPETVLDLSREQFEAAGLASKRGVLRDAAASYLRHAQDWYRLSPLRLVEELHRIPGVGRWTAHAAVADRENDWALYPAGDLTLRTWARRAAPDYPWPTDERAFANLWRVLTRTHLGTATVLTLAWGNRHADETDL